MKVKPFTAKNASAAMSSVRAELGDEAIIISVNDDEGSDTTTVLAATDDRSLTDEEDCEFEEIEDHDLLDTKETIHHALTYHGVPPRLIARLISHALDANVENPTLALAGALDHIFAFTPLQNDTTPEKVILVGPPGSGKTITAVKLATRAHLKGTAFRVATTDTQRAGGIEQLSAFTNILKTGLSVLGSVSEMTAFIAEQNSEQALFIDTSGINPYNTQDMDALYTFTKESKAEPVLVLPAGSDPMEAADMARPFADIGVKRLIVTRLDLARRVGGILGAAFGARLDFAETSLSPNVAEGLTTLNPVALARLIMPHTAPEQSSNTEDHK